MNRFSWRVSGRVQGVGFRVTAQRRAASLGLTGWVRNEPDGTVAMEVQGEGATIEELRAFLGAGNGYIRVDSIDETPLAVVADEAEFVVRR